MITINGETWSLYLVSPNHPILSGTLGVCDGAARRIYIADNLSLRMTKKVLTHEIVHAAMFSYNVPLDVAQEELIADLVATYGQEIVHTANKIFTRLKEGKFRAEP